MTSPTPVQQHQAPTQPRNGLGVTGFVLGLIGLVFAFIPLIGVIAWPLVILGIIFSGIGFARTRSGKATNTGLSIAGLVVSVVGLVICILWTVAFGAAVDGVNKEANHVATIDYDVTGTAPGASVTYSVFSSSKNATNQEQGISLPWHKEIKTDGLGKSGTLTVMTGAEGGTVTCKVTVDGAVAKTATAKGQFAAATCDNFGG